MNPLAANRPTAIFRSPPSSDIPWEAQILSGTRAVASNGTLVSLMVPQPAMKGESLRDLLLRVVPDRSEAFSAQLDAILALDEHDQAPDAQLALACMRILQVAEQPGLMCRLAQVAGLNPYTLGADSAKNIAVLQKIGPFWPRGIPMGLDMPSTLRLPALQALRLFLSKTREIHVHLSLYINAPHDAVSVAEIPQILDQRNFEELVLHVGSHVTNHMLQALSDRVHATRLSITCAGALPGPPDRAQWETVSSCLARFVYTSHADELALSSSEMPASLATRLVQSGNAWKLVELAEWCPFESHQEPWCTSIRNLRIVNTPPEWTPEHIQWLHTAWTSDLDIVGIVDLGAFARAVEGYALSSSGGVLDMQLRRITANVVLSNGDHLEDALSKLARHMPQLQIVHNACVVALLEKHRQLDGEAFALIEKHHRKCEVLVQRETYRRQTQSLQRLEAWWPAVQNISALLAPDRPVSHVADYLNSEENQLIVSHGSLHLLPEYGNDTHVTSKLSLMCSMGDCVALLTGAVEDRLRHHPEESRSLCEALISVDFRWLPTDWKSMSAAYALQWLEDAPTTMNAAPDSPTTTTTTSTTSSTQLTTTTTTTTITSSVQPDAGHSNRVRPTPQQVMARCAELARPEGVGIAQLIRDLDALQRRQGPDAKGKARARLLRNMIDFFRTGAIPAYRGELFAQEAMERNQPGLARYIASILPRSTFVLERPESAQKMKALAQHANIGGKHVLVVKTHDDVSLSEIYRFAATLKADQVTLNFQVGAKATSNYWDQARNFVLAHPGLSVNFYPGADEHIIHFLNPTNPIKLREIGLFAHAACSPGLVEAVRVALLEPDVQQLNLYGVPDDAAEKLLPLRHWKQLRYKPTGQRNFSACGVSASSLVLTVPQKTNALHPGDSLFKGFVDPCKGLEVLEIVSDKPVDAVCLAECLLRNPSIHSVRCDIGVSIDPVQEKRVVELLALRGPVNIELTNPRAGILQRKLAQMTIQQRLRDPDRMASETARGLTNSRMSADVAGRVVGWLDVPSLMNFSQTNRKSYRQSNATWRVGVRQLADLLAPNVGHAAFRAALIRQIGEQGPFDILSNSIPTDVKKDGIEQRVRYMQEFGVPDDVIAQAIRSQLGTLPLPALPAYLAALTCVGGIAPSVWLKEAYGIDLPAPSTPSTNPQVEVEDH